MITFGNGVHLSLRAAKVLKRDHGIRARFVGEDRYTPLGPAANLVLPQEEQIIATALIMCADAPSSKPSRKPARASCCSAHPIDQRHAFAPLPPLPVVRFVIVMILPRIRILGLLDLAFHVASHFLL